MAAPHTHDRTRWPEGMCMATAAQYLDVTPRYIEELLRDELIRAMQYREGGDRRILKAELDRFLKWRSEQPVRVKRSA